MSFITKRERVFSEYSVPANLPARNEGKLKAYASCTDTRAWSHFLSDKTEHLVEMIKRNNEVFQGKYVPVNVIIEMMMACKNSEITRLKHKIAKLESMISAYDQLELDCQQKCEISNAHAMIKAAYKSLEDLPPLELDMSGYTELTESEAFMTGKSGGDDGIQEEEHKKKDMRTDVEYADYQARQKTNEKSPRLILKESKGSNNSFYSVKPLKDTEAFIKKQEVKISTSDLRKIYHCDVSTSAYDPRLDELKEALISKDAKLNAMQNTIAVMESDVCEPYCIYAHIYTALEKIYATLSQNQKYKLFLNLMSSGKDLRCFDIKGKILFRLKILEKFSITLLAPCSERFKHDDTCENYFSQVSTPHVETAYALTSSESKKPEATKRAKLFADIMGSDDIKEILVNNKDSAKFEVQSETFYTDDTNSIETDNLTRLKNLQINYEDLMSCYENVKHERDNLRKRCNKYEEMETDFENLKAQLREYNNLYNEREYYRKRSDDLDVLKEQYLVLADETANLETQLKAETEINNIKSNTIDDLRGSNIALEQKLNEASIAFEKEKNAIMCKLKEAECKIMCQDQQIKSLTAQMDRLLHQEHIQDHEHLPQAAYVMDEIDELKSQIRSLNDALYCSEDEKQRLQNRFEANLQLINDLRMEIENWRGEYEKAEQKNEYLEKYSEGLQNDIHNLSKDVDEKNDAVANLINILQNKSEEVNRLMENMEAVKDENRNLTRHIQDLKDKHGISVQELETEKNKILESLNVAKKESKELLEKVKNYDELIHKNEDITKSLTKKTNSCTELQNDLTKVLEENKKFLSDMSCLEHNNSILLYEIQRLRDENKSAFDNLKGLELERNKLQESFEHEKKQCEMLEDKLKEFKNMKEQYQNLFLSHEQLIKEKKELENELQNKAQDLDAAINVVELTKKQSHDLLEKLEYSENIKEDMITLSKDYRILLNDKHNLQNDLQNKNKELDELSKILATLKIKNDELLQKSHNFEGLKEELADLKSAYENLATEKDQLQVDLDKTTKEIETLCHTLEVKVEENKSLKEIIKTLEDEKLEITSSFNKLRDINSNTQIMMRDFRKESTELLDKLKNYESLLEEHESLKHENDEIKKEKARLLDHLEKIQEEKLDLERRSGDITTQNEKLEKALADSRQELIEAQSQVPYMELLKETTQMRNQQNINHAKIKELLEKLDEADNIICNLSEDVLARDDKIAVLQNHINSLEDELQHLHQTFEILVKTGEELKDNSMKKLDHSLNIMEAHHSKATHSMKIELAKLKNDNCKLGEKLSITKINSDESIKETNKYKHEREIIVTDIKQLELFCIGDSNLSPVQCGIEEILNSLENIRKCIENRNSKNNSLEQTLLKVQTSSQLLLTKADEAKRLVEKEKQKTDQAIKEKSKLEQKLTDLKLQLQELDSHDKKVIRDLESELLNQKLIIDKLNQQTQKYISNLEEELKTLQTNYQNALVKINELQEKTNYILEGNSSRDALINKLRTDLATKSQEIDDLQNSLHKLKNIPKHDVKVQVGSSSRTNTKSQTDKLQTKDEASTMDNINIIQEIILDSDNKTIPSSSKDALPSTPKHTKNLKYVELLAVNVVPDLDLVKNSYIDYKHKQLQFGKLEQFSIPDDSNTNTEIPETVAEGTSIKSSPFSFTDIYNNDSNESCNGNNETNIGTSLSNVLPNQFHTTCDLPRSPNIITTEEMGRYKSEDNDLFLIYQESQSSYTDNKLSKGIEITEFQTSVLVESINIQPKLLYQGLIDSLHEEKISNQAEKSEERSKKYDEKLQIDMPLPRVNQLHKQRPKSVDKGKALYPIEPSKKETEKDGVKLKIDITLPKVEHLSAHPVSVESKFNFTEGTQSDTFLITRSDEPLISKKSDSRLNQVETDVLFLNEISKQDVKLEKRRIKKSKEVDKRKSTEYFGLNYLIDTIKNEQNPEVTRKSKSDVSIYIDSSNNLNVQDKNCSFETCEHKPKTFIERGVDVNMDAPDYYENKLQSLYLQLVNTEQAYKKKLEAIKTQYDNHIKSIINDHNKGVRNMQNLHEETLNDILKVHENEVENLRSMSFEAMRKVGRLEKENKVLKAKLHEFMDVGEGLDEEPNEVRKRRCRCCGNMKILSKTKIEALDVKPKMKHHGPCTCSLDVNVSDTIFEQVDVEKRKLAEHAFLKNITNKIMTSNVESLDTQELSFLHLQVCRNWKNKICKKELKKKRTVNLETQLLIGERSRQQNIADLDRDLEEQRHRLSQARNAVCGPDNLRRPSHQTKTDDVTPAFAHAHVSYDTQNGSRRMPDPFEVGERRSAGDLLSVWTPAYHTRSKPERRAGLSRVDETPTRLRRSLDRTGRSTRK